MTWHTWLRQQASHMEVRRRSQTLVRYPHLLEILQRGERGGSVVVTSAANANSIVFDFDLSAMDHVGRYIVAVLAEAADEAGEIGSLNWAAAGLYLPPCPSPDVARAVADRVTGLLHDASKQELELRPGVLSRVVFAVGVAVLDDRPVEDVLADAVAGADTDPTAAFLGPHRTRILVVDEDRPFVLFPRDGPASHLPPMLSEELTRIGFYRELPYGDRDGPSLRDTAGGLAAEDLGIVSYLRDGASIGSLPESPVDVLDPQSRDRESVYVLTDGRFKWPSQLAYYVERHRVRLPADLLNQARKLDWTCPTLDSSAAWRLQIEVDWDYGGPAAVVFDALAPTYDRHGEQSRLARQLLDAMGTIEGSVVDVACGTGQVAAALPDTVASILAVDASAGMVTYGRAFNDAPRVRWRTAPAVPLPVADGSIDVIMCASALHLLGRAALRDWHRALRPGGRVGYTLPLPSRWKPSRQIAALQARDIDLPADHVQAVRLAESAGLIDIAVTVRDEQIVTTARTPLQHHRG